MLNRFLGGRGKVRMTEEAFLGDATKLGSIALWADSNLGLSLIMNQSKVSISSCATQKRERYLLYHTR